MRDIDPSAQAYMESGHALMAALVFLDLASGPLRLNTSSITIPWDGHDWIGAGGLGSIEPVEETSGEHKPVQLSLSGMPAAVLSSVLGTSVRDRDCGIWLCILSPADCSVLDAVHTFSGKLSQAPISRSPTSRTVGVIAAHLGDYFARPKPFRNTYADQLSAYAGDTSRRFVVSQAQHQDQWPASTWRPK
jgi:hypothetical protein